MGKVDVGFVKYDNSPALIPAQISRARLLSLSRAVSTMAYGGGNFGGQSADETWRRLCAGVFGPVRGRGDERDRGRIDQMEVTLTGWELLDKCLTCQSK
jgi:hypothetical protein